MVPLEFQAVILAAGRGTRLPELTNDRPKCLLPVGPYPLVWYPLMMVQKHGFQGTRNIYISISLSNDFSCFCRRIVNCVGITKD